MVRRAEDTRLALTPNTVIPLFTTSPRAGAGGFVSVLIGMCDFATFLD